MNKNTPDRVSYLALLMVVRDRINIQRDLRDQRYFIDLAHELIRLYWEHDGGKADGELPDDVRKAA